jgi:hypothetical protein
MSQAAEDELLPWVVGGVLLIAATIAVAAVAGSGDNQAAPTAVHATEQRANNSSPEPVRAAAAPFAR